MKRSRDIRVIRTQTALLEALEELIKTKKLSVITITNLCTEAKINRNTFYYHYNNIIEFLEEHKQIVIDELNQIPEVGKTHNKENLTEIFRVLKGHPIFLHILISPNCDLDFFNDIFTVASEKAKVMIDYKDNEFSSRELMICNYYNAGCNAVICSWILNGMRETPEDITDIISQASRNGPISILFPGE